MVSIILCSVTSNQVKKKPSFVGEEESNEIICVISSGSNVPLFVIRKGTPSLILCKCFLGRVVLPCN